MDDSEEKTINDIVFVTKEEEGYVSATEEFPTQTDYLSPLEEEEFSTTMDLPKKSQEDIKSKISNDSNVRAQNTTSPDPRIPNKKQETQKNISQLTFKKTIEPFLAERRQRENEIRLEKVTPLLYNPDLNKEDFKQDRDLIVSSLEQHLKALVEEMVHQCIPAAEKNHETSEKLYNNSLFPNHLKNAIPKKSNEASPTSTQSTTSPPTSSIPRTRHFQQKSTSEVNSKRSRSKYSLTNRNSVSKSPKRQDAPQSTIKKSFEKHLKRTNSAKPLLLKYTEGINGRIKELLICTADSISDVSQSNPNGKKTDIIQNLVKISNQYVGKPLHVIFNPRNLPGEAKEDPVPLHPSPGRHDLLNTIKKNEEIPNKHDSPSKSPYNNGVRSRDVKNLESFIVLNSNCGKDQDGQESSSERKKLKIRQCRRRMSRTAQKRVDIKKVVSSVFKNIFHFYALLGGQLNSGAVITRFSSNIWLKQAGVAEDEHSLETASDVFMSVAGTKVVLNIFDYLKFLILYARQRRIVAAELVNQLTVCKLPQYHLRERFKWENFRRGTSEYSGFINHNRLQAHKQMWLRSLPNL